MTETRHENTESLQNRLGRLAILLLLLGTIAVEVAVPIISWQWIQQPFLGLFFEHTLVASSLPTLDRPVELPDESSLQLVAVDSQPVTDSRGLSQAVQGYTSGQNVELDFRSRDGSGRVQTSITIQRFPLSAWVTLFWLPYLIGLVYLGTGMWVFRQGREEQPARSTVLLGLFVALATGVQFDTNTTHIFTRIWICALPLSAAALVHLALVYPEERALDRRWPLVRILPYAIAGILIVAAQLRLTVANDPWAYLPTWRLNYLALILAVLAFVLLLYNRTRTLSAIARQQVRIVVMGSLLAFAPLLVYLVLEVLGFNITFYTTLYLPPLVIFPLAIIYAILRYRRPSMPLVRGRGLAYAILLAAIAGAYAGVLIVLGQTLGLNIIGSYPVLLALFVALLVFVLDPLRKGAERRAEELIALQQTALDVSGQQETPVLLQSIVERATRLLDASGGGVFLAEAGGERLRLVASHNLGENLVDVVLAKGEDVAGQVLLHGSPVRVEDYEQFPHKAQPLAKAQACSVLGVPLKWQDQVLGVLDVADTSRVRRFTREDEWLLTLFASQAAIALRNAQLFADLQRRVDQLDALRQISEAFDLRQGLDALLALIYDQTTRVLEVDNFYVALYDEMRKLFSMAYYVEEGEERVPSNPSWPLGTGLTSQIVRLREPIVTSDYLAECERRGVPSSGKPATAWLGVPLVTGPESQVLGVINVSTFQPVYTFSQEQVDLMCTIADQAAVAIERMHLYQAMEDRAVELATLNEVSRAVSSTLDLASIPGLIMKKVVDLMAVEAGSLLLVDEEAGDLVFKVALRGDEYEYLVGRRHPIGQGIVGCVAESGQSQIVNDAQSDPRWDHSVDQETGFVTQTILCVPMISRDKVVGVIEVINHRDGRLFTENEARLLEALAAQAAIAIENARLYTQTDQALANRVEELSTMQRIDRELNATLDFDHIMDMTLEWALRGTQAPTGVIALYDQEQQSLHLLASQGYPPEVERYRSEPWPLEEGMASRVIRSGQPVLVSDAVQEAGHQPILSTTRSQLLAPIHREGRVIGVVALESPQVNAFNQDALAFVQRLADHAAIAIENANLYEGVKQANRAKSEFIDFVAHELKQPMTSMQGYAKMLTMGIGGELTDTQRQFVEVITSNVDRMGKLVNDLLEISRLEAGRIKLKLSAVQLKDVVEETVTNALTEIEARHHTVVIDAPEGLPTVLGDRERLVQILSNLVSNAYKYTPDGGTIRITVDGQELPEETTGRLCVQVSDTGIGMSPEEIAKLDEKLFRAEHDLVRQQPGTGLGVSITRNLVELHGGELLIESQPGQGSTFSFTIPVVQDRPS